MARAYEVIRGRETLNGCPQERGSRANAMAARALTANVKSADALDANALQT